jgi:hypothetical protein
MTFASGCSLVESITVVAFALLPGEHLVLVSATKSTSVLADRHRVSTWSRKSGVMKAFPAAPSARGAERSQVAKPRHVCSPDGARRAAGRRIGALPSAPRTS